MRPADVASTSRPGNASSQTLVPDVARSPVDVMSWGEVAERGLLTPFYQTEPNPHATRRVLLVFFYFAPSAEVGALRWRSLSRFAADRGWAIDVVSLHPEFMGSIDPATLGQLPRGVRLFGFNGENPAWYRSMLGAWRTVAGSGPQARSSLGPDLGRTDHGGTLASPSLKPGWRRALRSRLHFALADVLADRAVMLGSELARRNEYAMVVSSGPPHAAHEAAVRIAARAGLPFVMDMRDPWSDESAMPEEFTSGTWRRAAGERERECVSSAELVVVTSKAHEELQVSKYPALRGRVMTVMNGADSDPLPASTVDHQFVVAFTGKIYLGRNPRALFRAAARVARETGASPNEFRVEFMGDDSCEGVPLTTIAAEEGLGAHFRSHGFRPRREALELLARASLLISLPLRTEMTLPAKLFEYTRFDAWLLALAGPESATARLLADTEADVVPPDATDEIAAAISERFKEFRAGVRPIALNHDGRFDRDTQSARLFDALDAIAAAPVSR